MLVECNHCGAPLDVKSGARVVACSYCNRQHKVPRMKTLAPETPTDWKPPPLWTPPPQARARSRPLRFHPVKLVAGVVFTIGRTLMALFAVGALMPVLVFALHQLGKNQTGGGATAPPELEQLGELVQNVVGDDGLRQLSRAVDDLGAGVISGMRWDGREPFRCENGSVTLEKVEAKLPGRTAVTVAGNCELRMVECTLESWQGIAVEGNGKLTVERSFIVAKGVAIDVSGNGHLELVETAVETPGTALHGSANAVLVLASGRVSGERAIELESNARADVREAEISGKVDARAGKVQGLPTRRPTRKPKK